MATPWRDPKSGRHYIRIAIPERLRSIIVLPSGKRGATLWKVSMRTTSPAEAKRRWPSFLQEYEAAKALAEQSAADPARLEAVAREWARGARQSEPEKAEEDDPAARVQGEVSRQLPRKLLVQTFGAEAVDANEATARSKMAEALYAEALNLHTLVESLEAWLADRKPTTSTTLDYKKAVSDFGAAKHVSKITRSDIVAYKDRLTAAGKLSRGSIKKRLNGLRAAFGYAVDQGWCQENPVRDIKVREAKVAPEPIRPFTQEHLATIFGGPVHSGGKRPKGGAGEAGYWLPLLALYTGARLNELGQLATKDVRSEGGIWFIAITDAGKDQRIKTVGSRRRVPLHRDIAAQFVAYVKKQKGPRVFPELRADIRGNLTGSWSKWWGNYLTRLRITERSYVFHSFRHTFKDLCREADIPKEVHDRLTGHSAGDVGGAYGDGPSLKKLAEAVAKIRTGVKVPPPPRVKRR